MYFIATENKTGQFIKVSGQLSLDAAEYMAERLRNRLKDMGSDIKVYVMRKGAE